MTLEVKAGIGKHLQLDLRGLASVRAKVRVQAAGGPPGPVDSPNFMKKNRSDILRSKILATDAKMLVLR